MSAAAYRMCVVIASVTLIAACSEPTGDVTAADNPRLSRAAPTTTVSVTSALPAAAPRDTTLDVQITGSGFDNGSNATFSLGGVVDARVRVNSTHYVKSTQLVANVTIAADAVANLYDVSVVTTAGKKGIGTELFTVTLKGVLLTGGTHGFAVNDLGDVVGRGTALGSCVSTDAPVIWHQDGALVRLPLGTYCGGTAQAINHSGVVMGSLMGGAANARGLWIPSGSSFTLLDVAPAPDGYRPITGGGMNDNMELVGWRSAAGQFYWWSSATGWLPMQMPTGATLCQHFKAINNLGEIAGKCRIGSGAFGGYYWRDHTASPVLLPNPGVAGDVIPEDINDAGVIAGYVYGPPNRAVIWEPNGAGFSVRLLPDLGRGSTTGSIASDGTISGSVITKSGGAVPVIWAPGGSGFAYLQLSKPGSGGDAQDVALTSHGLVVSGYQTSGATRWQSNP